MSPLIKTNNYLKLITDVQVGGAQDLYLTEFGAGAASEAGVFLRHV